MHKQLSKLEEVCVHVCKPAGVSWMGWCTYSDMCFPWVSSMPWNAMCSTALMKREKKIKNQVVCRFLLSPQVWLDLISRCLLFGLLHIAPASFQSDMHHAAVVSMYCWKRCHSSGILACPIAVLTLGMKLNQCQQKSLRYVEMTDWENIHCNFVLLDIVCKSLVRSVTGEHRWTAWSEEHTLDEQRGCTHW